MESASGKSLSVNVTKDVTDGRICEPLNCNSNTTHPVWQGSATRPSKSFRIFSGFWHLIYVRCIGILVATGFCLAAFTAPAAHTQAKLILSADTARPGDTIWAGVDLKMEPGWHTYWKNPGAAGMATEIKWQLPPGVTAAEIQWPLPQKLPPIEVTTYGYENEVMLIVPLKLGTNLPAGPIDLKANVSWLECEQQCVPGSTNVEATLDIGSEMKI